MASTSTKSQTLSYAERAKRASVGVTGTTAGPSSSRSPVVNGNPRSTAVATAVSGGTGSNSPENSSSINVTPSSSVILTRPVSPAHPVSHETVVEPSSSNQQQSSSAQVSAPSVAKPATKSPPANVWAARKEQMAQRVAGSQSSPSVPSSISFQAHTENTAPISGSALSSSTSAPTPSVTKNAYAASRPPLNGINENATHVSPQPPSVPKDRDDPFTVKMPSRQRSDGSTPGLILPSLDDAESWPEMGKAGKPASSPTIVGTSSNANMPNIEEAERKDSVTTTPKKTGEKTKWVPIPPAELQATADAILSQSQSHARSGTHSRSQSQHHHHQQQHNNQFRKSHSRQQSQARNGSRQNGNLNEKNNGGNKNVEGQQQQQQQQNQQQPQPQPQQQQQQQQQREAPKNPPQSREGSNANSRAESVVQSRTGSVHSSPRYPQRGRRLPEENQAVVTGDRGNVFQAGHAGSNTNAVKGRPSESRAESLQRRGLVNAQTQTQEVTTQPRLSYIPPAAPSSQVQHTPGSHSPVYYNAPPGAPYGGSPMSKMYNPLPVNNLYPTPMNSQRPDGQHPSQQQSYPPYSPYSNSQHLPPPQQQYPPYLYAQFPYGYYMPPGQGHEQQISLQSPYDQFGTGQSYFNAEQVLRTKGDESDNSRQTIVEEGLNRAVSPQLPPVTQISRPPPPGESNAVAGYREVGTVSVGALFDAPVVPSNGPQIEINADIGQSVINHNYNDIRSLKEHEVVFGSVGLPGGLKSPSPDFTPTVVDKQNISSSLALGLDIGEDHNFSPDRKPAFTAFSIGVKPGEAGPSTSRTRTRKRGKNGHAEKSRIETVQDKVDVSTQRSEPNGVAVSDLGEQQSEERKGDEGESVEQKVIDLTNSRTKWQFGSSDKNDMDQLPNIIESHEQINELQSSNYIGGEILSQMPLEMHHPLQQQQMLSAYGMPMQSTMGYTAPLPMLATTLPIPMQSPSPQSQQMAPHQLHGLGPGPAGQGLLSPLAIGPPPMSGPASSLNGEEWEVRDFGYGFGPTSGTGYMPERIREERLEREREREREFGYGPGRHRRGSNAGYGGYGYERGYDRGYGGGRRGRGSNGYGGRGSYGSRGGFGGRGQGGGRGNHHQMTQQPPYSVNNHIVGQSLQPQQQQAQVLDGTYYYAPQMPQYIQSPYEPYPQPLAPQNQNTAQQQSQPPFPEPVTELSFPLDSTRYSLLGQLEYYFSVQNLAQDLYLRQQMDSFGWLSIPLIASFNRVKQLTNDVQMVKDVLGLSSLVEVRDDYVRMRNDHWRPFVLPGAVSSYVEERETDEVEEEEEDDVVFVLGRDDGRPWAAERRRTEHTSAAV